MSRFSTLCAVALLTMLVLTGISQAAVHHSATQQGRNPLVQPRAIGIVNTEEDAMHTLDEVNHDEMLESFRNRHLPSRTWAVKNFLASTDLDLPAACGSDKIGDGDHDAHDDALSRDEALEACWEALRHEIMRGMIMKRAWLAESAPQEAVVGAEPAVVRSPVQHDPRRPIILIDPMAMRIQPVAVEEPPRDVHIAVCPPNPAVDAWDQDEVEDEGAGPAGAGESIDAFAHLLERVHEQNNMEAPWGYVEVRTEHMVHPLPDHAKSRTPPLNDDNDEGVEDDDADWLLEESEDMLPFRDSDTTNYDEEEEVIDGLCDGEAVNRGPALHKDTCDRREMTVNAGVAILFYVSMLFVVVSVVLLGVAIRLAYTCDDVDDEAAAAEKTAALAGETFDV